jgi:uncharacterized repeat protein (TIGR03803 family)
MKAQTSKSSFTVIYSFRGSGTDLGPETPLVVGSGGVLYGTTYQGGAPGDWGTVFSLTPPSSPDGAWTYNLLYKFTNTGDGACPEALVLGDGGVLYGLTSGCANSGYTFSALAFSLTPPAAPGGSWTEATIFDFASGAPAISEAVSLAWIRGGLYGTSLAGGSSPLCTQFQGCGAVFSLTPPASPGESWSANILYSFPGGNYQNAPSDLIAGPSGSFYGTASLFDVCPTGCGEVFHLTHNASPGGPWESTPIYEFTNAAADGEGYSGIALGAEGVIYGVTGAGGYDQFGTAFSLTPPAAAGETWTEQVLHKFGRPGDGSYPYPAMAIGPGGVLYGTTTAGGGTCVCGTVFAMAPPSAPGGDWTETVLQRFNVTTGGLPAAGVTIGPDGVIYGVTTSYGEFGFGTVFAITM